MTRTFVAIGDPVHNLLRSLTRKTPLVPRPSGSGPLLFEYQFKPADLPEDYYTLAAFHTLKGQPLEQVWRARRRVAPLERPAIVQRVGYFDAAKLDRRCARDMRLKISKHGPGMLAGELLSFGTGILRARNDDPIEPMHHYLWSRHGRIGIRREIVYARIRALHWNSLPLVHRTQKESYDSTNLIYGDALGELEQLWDRRADTDFLERVARSLQRMRGQAEIAAFLDPPLNLPGIMQLHRRQGMWKVPPISARSLLKRIEFLLEHTAVDPSPCTHFRTWEPEPHSDHAHEPAAPEKSDTSWQTDASGYDGWLADDAE
jgi:hypothetical protein